MATVSDTNVRNALKTELETAFPNSKVITRWRQGFTAGDIKNMLNSVSTAGLANGWILKRISVVPRSVTVASDTWDVQWVYLLWYFRSSDDRTTEYDVNSNLDAFIERIKANQMLGLSETNGFMGLEPPTADIDTIEDGKYHWIQMEIVANITLS